MLEEQPVSRDVGNSFNQHALMIQNMRLWEISIPASVY